LVFSSIEFLLYFLPVFFLLYWISPEKIKNVTLVSGSLVFYAYGEPVYIILLILSVYINYYIGLCLGNNRDYDKFEDSETEKEKKNSKSQRQKRMLIWTSVTLNVGALALLKWHVGGFAFPLGMSFYTFQILAYHFDVYRGVVEREGSLLAFATYITMFPKLISGPIGEYSVMQKELTKRRVTALQVQDGLKVFAVGLGLKVLLADRVGILWHEIQVTGFESISTPLAWLGAFAYSMKIYFDFYGYSLMAIGLGRMLGFTLPKNFDNPYMAKSVREFYRRWHITLGKWFCRYVYIPLGGSHKKAWRTVCNLLVVWLLTAVWHGTTINFLLWGGILWVCIVLERVLLEPLLQMKFIEKCWRVFSHLYIWIIIPISWMCFAIAELDQLIVYLGRMFNVIPGIYIHAGDWIKALSNYGLLLGVSVVFCTPLPEKLYRKWKDSFPGICILAALFWLSIHRIMQEGNNPFMYFRF